MASDAEYVEYITERAGCGEALCARKMMGEYLLYFRGKLFGGIYDNRLLVKDTPEAREMMADARREVPYAGAKEMLLVEEVDNGEFLRELMERMWEGLPERKEKKKNRC